MKEQIQIGVQIMFPFSDEELTIPVKMAIDKVRPMLLRDGGDITILGIKDAKVYVQLEGHCRGCASSHLTLKNGILYQLQTDIHPEIGVIEVKPGENWEEIAQGS